MPSLASLSDEDLLRELHVIVGSHRRVTAELILHLGEVDARRLHVDKGFSSLFSYCVELLHFSEDEACRRIEATRLARRFPAIYPLLETAAVSLTVLGLLKPHLTDDNHRELLTGVSGSSVRQAKEWIAARFPEPDVASSVRKLPERRSAPLRMPPQAASVSVSTNRVLNDAEPLHGAPPPAPTRQHLDPLSHDRLLVPPPAPTRQHLDSLSHDRLLVPPPAPTRQHLDPLSHDRFLVKFTASRSLREKLELASNLMRHANPTGELTVVLERAMDLLIVELERKKQGRSSRPQKKARPAKETCVSRAARREVVARDGWRCSFVAKDGRRCEAQGFLEFDHQTPKGRGGGSQAENLRVLCRQHNRLAAELVYGKAHVARAISDARRRAGKTLTVRETVASYGRVPDTERLTKLARHPPERVARWG